MKRKLIKTIITISAACLVISACSPPDRRNIQNDEPAAPAEKSFNIKTVTVERKDISNRLMLSGDVEAAASVDVYPETSGKLTEINVQTGSRVTVGQVIAKVDPSRPGMNYTESPVKATISGTVTEIFADTGASVGPQMPLATIGDISRLVITTNIPERYIYIVEKGQKAWVTTTAAPGMKYEATVSSVAPVVNPVSRTLEIQLRLNGSSPVKAGMFVGIELRTSTSENSLVLPEKSIVSRDENTCVYRITDNRAEKVNVSVGIKDSGFAEITEGLAEGDIIAVEGVTLLSDGAKIKIINDEDGR